MTASLKAIDGSADLPVLMNDLARSARAAARALAVAPTEQKNGRLRPWSARFVPVRRAILAANAEDVAEVRAMAPHRPLSIG